MDQSQFEAEEAGARPADVARRALRAAREREVRGDESADGESGQPDQPAERVAADPRPQRASSPGARPGDAAREALRRATAAGRSAGTGAVHGTDAGAAAASDGAVEPSRPQSPAEAEAEAQVELEAVARTEATPTGSPPAERPRPGDIAREALRAARSEARQTRTDAGTQGGRDPGSRRVEARRRSTDPAPTDSRAPRNPRSQNRRTQAQDLRDLLAGAFQLPSDIEAAVEASSDSDPEQPPDATRPSRGAHPRSASEGIDSRPAQPDAAAVVPPDGPPPPVRGAIPDRRPAQPGDTTVPSPDAPPPPAGGATPDPHPAHPRPVERPPVAPTRLPRSMGSPGRDGDLRRTFEAFPARESGAGGFAETWWGNAWVSALEEGALDAARLARGRAYAGRGHVDAITVTPGLVLAYVHGSRPRPYRVQVALETLPDGDWDRFLDAVAERPGDIAALLDKEMPKSLAECGVALLPGPGELEPHCSCPDSGHPCKHAAALCYQTARLLDEDPFVLLLLRGRGERELLDALSRRNAARIARAAQDQEPAPLPGIRARDALARRALAPLPAPLPPPAHPEQPPTYPGAPGGPDPFALDQLATDAAARAHTMLTAGRDPVAGLTLWQDAVRLAAARPGSGLTAATRTLYASLSTAAGRTRSDLARAVAAWRQGGFEGLAVLEEPWDPPAGRFDRARPLLLAADLPAFRPWHNHLTHPRGHAQLRLGHNGLWYAYESEPGQEDWWPRGTPDLDPVGALTGLGAPGDL
ncbi:SWIM zinc finger family protein [Streptomyces sp. NBC_00038]|uniref:SWIM zinc finger family protein n=1 Tax=Streptomyces sp. NBC_00038 TaxID=2903615 RepID=UPI00225B168E|nr:SWIM zinc finger family protein [Streptomyces sp. NBC_00038]MCX5561825.1 SWIM zinc finger family protein [Streptomyces sp. NBC_00038]